MRKLSTLLAAAAIATLAACATNPATGNKEFSLMSEAQEVQLGQELDVQVKREMGVYEDAELQRYGFYMRGDSYWALPFVWSWGVDW